MDYSALSAGTLRPAESGASRANGPGNSRETSVVNETSHYVTVRGPRVTSRRRKRWMDVRHPSLSGREQRMLPPLSEG